MLKALKRFHQWSKNRMGGSVKSKSITIMTPIIIAVSAILLSVLLNSIFVSAAFKSVSKIVSCTIFISCAIMAFYFIVLEDLSELSKKYEKLEGQDSQKA
jgi:hypothetical protein